MATKSSPRRVKLPRIGPCRDPLHLWFLEWEATGQVWRRYFADRDEARAALAEHRRRGPLTSSPS